MSGFAQATNPVLRYFPSDTKLIGNIPYANDTLRHHLLDIYLPAKAQGELPLVIWMHGGAWNVNDKYADMSYMKATIKSIIEKGYAFASIDYRYSTESVFPAQIQDCNQAVEFLYQNAKKYGFNRDKIALMGFSAGGHLANLLALSNNNSVAAFYPNQKKVSFKIKAVVDFYGPVDFLATLRNPEVINDPNDSVTKLLGASPLARPDLAKAASPLTYLDKNDPPFLIIQGEKDQSVSPVQSMLLSSWLNVSGISNELIIVPNAPHYGVMFDEEYIRTKIFNFLNEKLNK